MGAQDGGDEPGWQHGHQLTNEYQAVSCAVNTNTTPEVQYAYTEMSGGQNNSRLTSMTYPSAVETLPFNYNTGLDNNISRLSSISDSTGVIDMYGPKVWQGNKKPHRFDRQGMNND